MLKYLPLLLLAGCASSTQTGLAPGIQIPPLTEALAKRPERLPPLVDNTMGTLVLDTYARDTQYYNMADQLDTLINLYNCVRSAVNQKKNPNEVCS